jgi:hypothetical protein
MEAAVGIASVRRSMHAVSVSRPRVMELGEQTAPGLAGFSWWASPTSTS